MADSKKLQTYRKRRDLTRSPEPYGSVKKTKGTHIFVVQKHDASHLHYDFRLEIEGVLVSWAIPKGPILDPKIKRLAMPTDDHPMEYGNFEGIIPEGSYGAGTVMLWDKGTFTNLKEKNGKPVPLSRCLKEGRIEVWLEGKKLQGGFALIKTKGMTAQKGWLLIKMRDEYAQDDHRWKKAQEKSVKTGRTLKQIADQEG